MLRIGNRRDRAVASIAEGCSGRPSGFTLCGRSARARRFSRSSRYSGWELDGTHLSRFGWRGVLYIDDRATIRLASAAASQLDRRPARAREKRKRSAGCSRGSTQCAPHRRQLQLCRSNTRSIRLARASVGKRCASERSTEWRYVLSRRCRRIGGASTIHRRRTRLSTNRLVSAGRLRPSSCLRTSDRFLVAHYALSSRDRSKKG